MIFFKGVGKLNRLAKLREGEARPSRAHGWLTEVRPPGIEQGHLDSIPLNRTKPRELAGVAGGFPRRSSRRVRREAKRGSRGAS